MSRYVLPIAIVALWLHAMTMLALREVVPAFRQAREAAEGLRYSELRRDLPGVEDTRMGLYKVGPGQGIRALRRVGTLDRRVWRKGEILEIRVRTTLDIEALVPWMRAWSGRVAEVVFQSKAVRGRLVSLQMEIRQAGKDAPIVSVTGAAAGDKLSLRAETPLGLLTRVIPYDSRFVVTAAETPALGMPKLHVGRRWKVRLLDPLSGRVRERWARVTRREGLRWQDEDVMCHVVEVDGDRFKSTAWVDDEGRVLKLQAAGFVFLLEPSPLPVDEAPAVPESRKESRP